MSGIKVIPADKWFSLCIRERADNVCERCGTDYKNRPGLQNCHYETRRNYSIRFEPINCFAMCYGCHQLMDSSRIGFSEFYILKRGQVKLDVLTELSRDLMRGKENRRNKKEIAEYYADVYESMLLQRSYGVTGWLDFVGYQ